MIPKKIHQFWTGGPMPDAYVEWCAQWRETHPDWEYRLWSTEDVFDLDMEIGECMIDGKQHPSIQSDLARVTVVYHEGGIYLDTDFEPRKTLDPVIALGLDGFIVPQGEEPACAVFGSVPKSLWLELCREAAISYAWTDGPWAPVTFYAIAKRYGVKALDTNLFYPYKWWEREQRKDDPFPDAIGIHRHGGSWCGGQPDVPKR